jgi:hypothetical protein
LFTRNGKVLTAKSVKPICPFHQIFRSTYLFGAFSPLNGSSFLLELPLCNAHTFQRFLDEFSGQEPQELKVIVLDNGAFHKAKELKIPENIVLIFLPPYSPELNPAEKVWAKFKRDFTNRIFYSLEMLQEYVCGIAARITRKEIKSIAAYEYIFLDKYWTNI